MALWATLSSLSLDFRTSRIGGHHRAVPLARWSPVLDRLPATLSSLSLDFSGCGIGQGGVRAVAERLPGTLTSLSLNFLRCGIGEGGARAVREAVGDRFSARLGSLTLFGLPRIEFGHPEFLYPE